MKTKKIIHLFIIILGIYSNGILVFATPTPNKSWLSLPESQNVDAPLTFDVEFGSFHEESSTVGVTFDAPKEYYDIDTNVLHWYPLHKDDYLWFKIQKTSKNISFKTIAVQLLSYISKTSFKTINIPVTDSESYTRKINVNELPYSSVVELKIKILDNKDKLHERIIKIHTHALLHKVAQFAGNGLRIGSYSDKVPTGPNGGCYLHIRTFPNEFDTDLGVAHSDQFKAELVGTSKILISGDHPVVTVPDTIDLLTAKDNILPFYVEQNGAFRSCYSTFSSYQRTYDYRLTTLPSSIDFGEGYVEESYVYGQYNLKTNTEWNNKWISTYLTNGATNIQTWFHTGSYAPN